MNALKTFAAACLVAVLVTGCTTAKQVYDGHPSDQVWLAMKTVAESPNYDDWHVRENEVWVDEPAHRIEIYRKVHRLRATPVSDSLYEEKEWKFRILLVKDDPPTVKFISRSFAVPAYAYIEADRYFQDVLDILSAPPAETK